MLITGIVLFLIFGGGVTGAVQNAMRRHHKHRLDIIAAKAELAQSKNAALRPPPDPQPICGCTHHLSFHNPATSTCAVDGCRCQQYIGPEPLGHIVALPLIDPQRMSSPATALDQGQPARPVADAQ
jgi:hypothetical protein